MNYSWFSRVLGTNVGHSTLRPLGQNGLIRRIAAKKPFLRNGNKHKSLQCMKGHKAGSEEQLPKLMEQWVQIWIFWLKQASMYSK